MIPGAIIVRKDYAEKNPDQVVAWRGSGKDTDAASLIAQVAGLYAADIRLYSRKIGAAGLMFPAPVRKGKQ